MRVRLAFGDFALVVATVALIATVGFLVLSEKPGGTGLSLPSISTSRNSYSQKFDLQLGSELAADFGLGAPIWILGRETSVEIWNTSSTLKRLSAKIGVSNGVCLDNRRIAFSWPNGLLTLTTGSDGRSRGVIQTTIDANSSIKILISTDGFPCLTQGDPRKFYGQLTIALSQGS